MHAGSLRKAADMMDGPMVETEILLPVFSEAGHFQGVSRLMKAGCFLGTFRKVVRMGGIRRMCVVYYRRGRRYPVRFI